MRIALGIEYDGSDFRGWQSQQSGVRTVQNCVEKALAKVADQPVSLTCAGRTDAGVHASAQVVHFDTTAQRRLRAWVLGANSNLPDDICVTWARVVPAAFNARFSATARRYCYRILNRAVRSALQRRRVTWYRYALDEKCMQQGAEYLLGEHDFSAFRAVHCQAKSVRRKITKLCIKRRDDLVLIDIEANAFLHHMVRNIVGVLLEIGRGERAPEWARQVLLARDRAKAGVTAPAAGLSLVAVRYPAEFSLPEDLDNLGFAKSMD